MHGWPISCRAPAALSTGSEMSMTPQQRYMLDTFGFLKLEAALSASELAAAQEAADRYITLAQQEPEALPPGFEQDSNDNRRFVYGFAFDKGLEALATHPAIMPIVIELTGGRPQLTMGTLQADGQPSQNFHNEGLSLHRAGDDSIPGTGPKLGVGPDGRMYCDDIVIFPYLDDVNPGDGARATPLSRLSLSRCVRACMCGRVCGCLALRSTDMSHHSFCLYNRWVGLSSGLPQGNVWPPW